MTGVEFGMEEPSRTVEVALVESAPPEAVAPPPAPEPPQPEPIPEPPKPEPEPELMPEPPKPKEETIPLPPEPKPEPKPAPKPVQKPEEKRQKPAPTRTATTPAAASSNVGTPGATAAATGAKGGTTSGPAHLYNPKPAYPPESRAAKEHGTVLIAVAVDVAGRPGSVRLSQSSGFPRLDRAAQEAVRRWRFKPAMRNSIPYASSVTVPIRFALPK